MCVPLGCCAGCARYLELAANIVNEPQYMAKTTEPVAPQACTVCCVLLYDHIMSSHHCPAKHQAPIALSRLTPFLLFAPTRIERGVGWELHCG